MQQAIVAMRAELDATKAQLLVVSQKNEQLRANHQQLEHNTATVFNAQMQRATDAEQKVAQLESRTRAGGGKGGDRMDLLNLKNVKPDVFASKDGESWKPCAKKTKLFLNGKAPEFRAALKAAEKETAEIQPGLSFTQRAAKEEANEQLHEFLLHQTTGRAFQIAEEVALDGRGFETWRRLKEEF
jgi:hypothetical protein